MLYKEMNEVERYMQYTTYFHKQGKAEMVANSFKKKFGTEPEDLRRNLLKLSPEVLDELIYALFSTQDTKHFLQMVENELPKN